MKLVHSVPRGGAFIVNNKITQSVQKKYNRFAPCFDLMEGHMARGAFAKYREEIWHSAQGEVLEVGVGTGVNLSYYPKGVHVTGIDFSDRMLERAQAKKEKLKLNNVDLYLMDAQNMDFPDNSFDTIITTCVFCTVPDPVQGFKEIRRVCKPDGKILMLEHIRSGKPILGTFMDVLNPVIYSLVGTNINRNTLLNIEKAGLEVVSTQYLISDIFLKIIASPNKS